jgi:hypothetical protein
MARSLPAQPQDRGQATDPYDIALRIEEYLRLNYVTVELAGHTAESPTLRSSSD